MVGSISARIDVELGNEQEPEAAIAARQAEFAAAIPAGVLLVPPELHGDGRPVDPDEQWTLASGRRYYRDAEASGMAAVYYANGHHGIVQPMIIADGFNYGTSDLDGLYAHLNESGFLDQLSAAGIDVILLGFTTRHSYIQANAGVAISCIRQAIQERSGDAPLIVSGLSMGGLITRFALAAMEHDG